MDKRSKRILGMFSRYISVILLGLGNLYLFYKILTPITIKASAFTISLFREISVTGNLIDLGFYSVQIVPACVAGSAFYLMYILIFSMPKIKPLNRAKLLLISFASLFVLNIIRIAILAFLVSRPSFEAIHWFLWNIGSTFLVLAIWIALTEIYKLKSIPIYSDLKYTFNLVKKSRN